MATKHTISLLSVAALVVAGWMGYKALNAPSSSMAGATASGQAATSKPAGAPQGKPGQPGAGQPGASKGGPPPRAFGVEVAKVQTKALKNEFQTVGNLRSRQNAMIKPEIAGRVAALGFADGQAVRAGQWLVQLDDTLQRAEVQQALAQVSIAKANFKRNQELVAQNFVAQRVLEESAASLSVTQAQLALACARLQRMRIVAPFAGVVGIRSINLGDYVKDGADLVNLEDIHALYVDFRLPERQTSALSVGQMVQVQLDALPGRVDQAKVVAIDPLIDANGRFLTVRAMLENRPSGQSPAALKTVMAKPAQARPASPELAQCPSNSTWTAAPSASPTGAPGPLRPGMFARINVVFSERPDALVVPEAAIVPQGGKQFVVLAIKPESTAQLPAGTEFISKRIPVKLGIRSPGEVEVTEGLQPSDVVVIAGQQRLQRDGTPMRVVAVGKP